MPDPIDPSKTSAAVAALKAMRTGQPVPPAPKPPVAAAAPPPATTVQENAGGDEGGDDNNAAPANANTQPGTEDGNEAGNDGAESPAVQAFAPRFAALRREQAEITRARLETKTREEELTKKEQAIAAREAKLADARAAALEDPSKAFELLELDEAGQRTFYENMAAWLAAGKKPTPEMKARAAALQQNKTVLTKVEELQQELAKERQEKAVAKQQAQQAQVMHDISGRISGGGEKFEYTKAYGDDGSSLVFEMAQTIFKEKAAKLHAEGKLTEDQIPKLGSAAIDEALELAEKHFEAEADRLLTLEKTKKKIPSVSSATPSTSRPNASSGPSGSSTSKTLTNSLSAEPPAPTNKPKSDEERKAEAIEALRSLRKRRA